MSIINEYLETYPLPWRLVRGLVDDEVRDANGDLIWSALGTAHDLIVSIVEFVNLNAQYPHIVARKDALLGETAAKIEELRKERDNAVAQCDNLLAANNANWRDVTNEQSIELAAAREDAAEMHGLCETQRELIERLQKRLAVLEARQ